MSLWLRSAGQFSCGISYMIKVRCLAELDIQDGSVTWLVEDNDCYLGVHVGILTRAPVHGLSMWPWLLIVERRVFQERWPQKQCQGIQLETSRLWIWPWKSSNITTIYFLFLNSRGNPESRRIKHRRAEILRRMIDQMVVLGNQIL